MKIAYVTTGDPWDVCAWSGLVTHILQALQGSDLEVEAIGNLNDMELISFIKGALYGRLFSKIYLKEHEPRLLKYYAAQLDQILVSTSFDIVFSPRWVPAAYLQTDLPIVFWHDSTLPGLVDLYPGYRFCSAESIRNGMKAEQLALRKCCLAIYSSEWAASSAIQHYAIDPTKVKVVPFGANLSCDRKFNDIQIILAKKDYTVCKLLFIGKEWVRKGGDTAVSVVEELLRRSLPAELHVVGCHPPGPQPGFVKAHGFVSKTSEQGRQLLDQLFSQAHFLILPTRADCTPVVFPEACSFGLPVLSTKVGGISTIIQDGKNGQTFPLDAGPEVYCDYIERLWLSKDEYEQLAISSFKEYSERLNWESAGRKVSDLLHEFCT